PEVETSVAFVTMWRAITGFICGIALYRLLGSPAWYPESPIPVYLGLIPLRMSEWAVLLFLFFVRHVGWKAARRYWVDILLGTVWSFALDLGIMFGIVLLVLYVWQP